ncbi:voltage-dependent calcium channel gamma-6 subunit isoform X2 [Phyllopteryx taeniolatus]|uniref:voltage-dependent calcium channel gamma-6 subunit isoform X2 n=1 Tax=Phyllopteryx taeniolatus TaxID=161469 RepID=UPI002AD226BE|nr:voltage-dependent calcium channel gamma-6 subunit isoform X2 [Phyllopteryx taeniolatus]
MWNNFFVPQDEEGRVGAAASGQGGGLAALKGGRAHRRSQKMSDSQDGKIKLAFLVCAVGVTLTVLGVGTEFWVELAQPKNFDGNHTCQMAHYGLWKACVHTLWVADVDPERTSCGPAELPGDFNLAAAILALLSLTMMVTGSICILMTLSKGVSFFLKPASFCFILSGILVLVSILMFHQSVLALLSSDRSIPLHHQLSWSADCVGSAGAILIFGGLLFVILSLPVSSCLPHKNNTT